MAFRIVITSVREWERESASAHSSKQADNAINQQSPDLSWRYAIQIYLFYTYVKVDKLYREHWEYEFVRSFEVRMYWLTQSNHNVTSKGASFVCWFSSYMSCRFAVLISDSILYTFYFFKFCCLSVTLGRSLKYAWSWVFYLNDLIKGCFVWDSSALSAPNKTQTEFLYSLFLRPFVVIIIVDDNDNDVNVNKLSCLNAFQFK